MSTAALVFKLYFCAEKLLTRFTIYKSTQMEIKGIKNLLIDFGGVLIDLDRDRCIGN